VTAAAVDLACAACGLSLDPAWAAARGRTTHGSCPEPALAGEPPARVLELAPEPPPLPPLPRRAHGDESLDWQEFAACNGTDLNFHGTSTAAARRVCNGTSSRPPCPVRERCLEYADERETYHYTFGVWGGLSAAARRRRRLEREAKADG
jgi:hypothetical protein